MGGDGNGKCPGFGLVTIKERSWARRHSIFGFVFLLSARKIQCSVYELNRGYTNVTRFFLGLL